MRAWRVVLLVLVACGDCAAEETTPDWLGSADEPAQHATPEGLFSEGLAGANNRFALALYEQLAERPGNLVFSPASIASALSMTYAGARGETASEMADALHFAGLQAHEVHSSYRRQLAAWNEDHGGAYELRVVNRMFVEGSLALNEEYSALTRDSYGAAPQPLDFRHDPEGARLHINDWVKDNTGQAIRDLLPPRALSPQSQLVIANAVYFRGLWRSPFQDADTELRPFFAPEGERNVATMVGDTSCYPSVDGVEVVRLPYVSDFEMLILMPVARDGLAALERRLTPEMLSSWLDRRGPPRPVRLFLPKFSDDTSLRLGDALRRLGLGRALGSGADFSGMSSQPLEFPEVAHRALIEVNEEGTVATAATATYGVMGPQSEPRDLHVDHPFIFIIRDTRTGAWLFVGRIVDPR